MNLNNNPRVETRRNACWLLCLTALTSTQGKLKRREKLFVITFIFFIFASFDAASKDQTEAIFDFGNKSEPVFHFQHKYKDQIVFSLKIYQDGKVVYRGYSYSSSNIKKKPTIEEHHSQITLRQVNELSKYFLSLPFKELKKYEEKRSSVPVFDIIFFKSAYVHIEMVDAIFFKAMTKELKKITDIQDWVCHSESQSNSAQACLEDLPDDFQY